ncbi:MAG: Ig-like domain-containing protein, partial [Solirubrobacterales bacterium]
MLLSLGVAFAALTWVADPAGATSESKISAGSAFTCAIAPSGDPACWGLNDQGQALPPTVAGGVTSVSAGTDHACAVEVGGDAVCWGADASGQIDVPTGLGAISAISAGDAFTCAIQTDGTPVCWGADASGETDIPSGIGSVDAISAGGGHACAIQTDGTPVCWGDDSQGEASVPGGIGSVTDISAGTDHTCAIDSAAVVSCWGNDASGQSTPPAGERFSAISSGDQQTCAVTTSGAPICWGGGADGEGAVPSGLTEVDAIAAGATHSCALEADRLAVCWGASADGELGGAPTFTSSAPSGLLGPGTFIHTFFADSHGGPPPRFFVSAGQLPPGVLLDGATGVLSGTPTVSGHYSATVTVTNDFFTPDDEQSFALDVDLDAPPTLVLSISPSSPGQASDVTISAAGETGSVISLYSTPDCSGTPDRFDADELTAGHVVSVGADSVNVFSATATDAAGNVSNCSASISYTADNTAPTAPTLTLATTSPGKSTTPTITGTAEAGATITLYKTAACTSTGTTYTQAQLAAGVTPTVTDNATTAFSVTATDAAGNVSGCSNSVSYTADNTKPATPSITLTTASPGKSTTPTITGTAETGATVTLYKAANCTSTGTTYTQAQLAAGIAPSVTDNTTTTFSITATDAAGNVSDCSASISYTADNTAPLAPSITLVTTSPGKTLTPTIVGTAEVGSTIALYKTANCTNTGTTYTQAQLASGIAPTVADNSTTSFSITATDAAGNVSNCSASISYTADNTAPAAPAITLQTASPGKTLTPTITGTAETGSTITLYKTANCTSTSTTYTQAQFAAGIAASVTDNATTSISVTATDAAGNVSACSNAVSYTADNTKPATPTLTLATASPGKTLTPALTGSAETNSTITLYKTSNCTSTGTTYTQAQLAAGIAPSVTDNTTTTFSITATDAAGNVSDCSTSVSYTADNTAPTAPTITMATASPGKTLTPTVTGSAEAGSTITLYKTANCTSTGTTYTQAQLTAGVTPTVANNATTSITATATDAAGNISGCSNVVTYTADNTAPTAPTLTLITTSPGKSTTPTITGTAEAGATITLYKTANCTSTGTTYTQAQLAAG